MIQAEGLSFAYSVGGRKIEILRGLDFRVARGEFACIQGPSGSGKSTLFYILGLMLRPSAGRLRIAGRDAFAGGADRLARARNEEIGFVFQQFHLLAKASVLDNILLPARYPTELARPETDEVLRARARELARLVGLEDYLDRLPNQLSGGQQQRVAIARALLNDAELILADEPTGNLDTRNAAQIMDLLHELNARGKTIVIITHDPEIAARCTKVYHLRDGAFTQVEERAPPPAAAARAAPTPARWDASFARTARAVLPLVRENLLRNKAKSLLTMLGVIIGVAAVLAMVTLGQFTRRRILASYEQLGANKLLIRGYNNWNLKATDQVSVDFKSFDWERDLLPLKRIFPEVRYLSPSLNSWRHTASAGGLSAGENKVSVLGVAPEYQAITSRIPSLGRGINAFHVDSRSPVCTIGYGIARDLFRRTQPLGQILTVAGDGGKSFACLVIGVLPPVTSTSNWNEPDLQVLVPYTYFRSISANWWEAQIHDAVLTIDSGADVEAAGKKIKAYFEQRYGKSGQFFVDSDSVLVAQMKRFLNLFAVLLAGIAVLSLAVGGIGINNMMLVSVNERLKEFGLRKALGATDRSLRAQVLLESVVLCAVAGLIGIAAGFAAYELMILGATRLVSSLKFEWVFDPAAAGLSLLSIVAVGIASGLVPALRAEKLQVIEALRSE